jgi:colanic acid/amylovoran biosynthesis glycosyltransferase
VGRWLAPTETWIFNQIVNLPKDRASVSVVANEHHPDTPTGFTGVKVDVFADHPTRYRLRQLEGLVRRRGYIVNDLLRARVRSHDTDLIHSHFGPTGWVTSRLADHVDVPQVVTFYGYDVAWLPTRFPEWLSRYEELFDRAEAVLCEGAVMASTIGRLGCPTEKLRVHHLGVDLSEIPFRPRPHPRRGPLRVLMAARFFEKKGFPDGVRAVAGLRNEVPSISVTIAGNDDGSPESQAERKAIENAIEETSLGDVVSFLGLLPTADLRRLANDHHVFLSPSRTSRDGDTEGGAPVSIIEMAASGMPVVSTTHCDIPSVLGEPNRGLLSPEGDVEALRRQLEALLQIDNWTDLERANREHTEREYDVLRQSERLADLYDELTRR